MRIEGTTAIVTGGAQGIGAALVRALKDAGAAKVISADLHPHDTDGADECLTCDVSRQDQIEAMIDHVEATHGPVGLMCSNAGILTGKDSTFDNIAFADAQVWDQAWAVNVMAHVHAARYLIPKMKSRGGGYFLHTASAAGLLNQVGSAVYGVTKHAAVGFAEALAFGHRDDGIGVSVLCPQGVDTEMVRDAKNNPAVLDGVLPPAQVAQECIEAIENKRFLVLPHKEVAQYMQVKANDYDRWIGGMARLQRVMKTQGE
ncbi:SDR family oxidoreductase [Lutimaribacter sp. EGI FJ00015]|uniref:SDR family oxidoreductase n=1 Tax=Lutimaribacter degradans TaxID=2945989 RepID=A0ACC5ZWZ5_9RHOB|nr:SDR family oxidoreductase [Lutimaribacter sp. EGI FJ00013]MCM2562849.1 SDR family oxidoreductase [Lutimaribacter sp. EGI FJ00013]MCO0614006.1 SDR family oxidoreductase [Lutimaribacter sp. EGI FJ00015]MCO0636978.1 SDR family oxidoreductase [Lutimaribacter sp. EGI FJ00014]